MTAFLVIIGWLACGVAAYILAFRQFRREGRPWTLQDRLFGSCLAVSSAPVFFVMALYYELGSIDWDRPVKW